jgi:hypothetical protein
MIVCFQIFLYVQPVSRSALTVVIPDRNVMENEGNRSILSPFWSPIPATSNPAGRRCAPSKHNPDRRRYFFVVNAAMSASRHDPNTAGINVLPFGLGRIQGYLRSLLSILRQSDQNLNVPIGSFDASAIPIPALRECVGNHPIR